VLIPMSSLRLERPEGPPPPTDPTEFARIQFSTRYSSHMLVAAFESGRWTESEIRPYGPLQLVPNITALQSGISVFEGLKAHRSPAGQILLFRPWDNARRLNRSAERLAMPRLPESLFLTGLRKLLQIDARWVPPLGTGALYIRPMIFSVDGVVRIKPADQYLFIIVTFPFGAYFSAPVDVLITEQYVRAFPGGTGDVKLAGNYAPTLVADREAKAAGCDTVLWLDGPERRYVEECGVMNVFFVVDDRVITPPLGGTILPGVTRDSVIQLLRDRGIGVEERRLSVDELVTLHREGRLRECFGTGTAATITQVRRIRFRGDDLILPAVEARPVGPSVREQLVAIVTGQAPDRHGWVDEVTLDQARPAAANAR